MSSELTMTAMRTVIWKFSASLAWCWNGPRPLKTSQTMSGAMKLATRQSRWVPSARSSRRSG